jgi:predicted translin family RNA/ssDNA-binding protein
VENILSAVEKKQECDSGLTKEGAYNAGLEEYTEAYLFRQFLVGEELSEVKKISVKPNIFVGGLADVPGELYRYAIKSATVRDVVMVKKCQSVSEEIIKAMLDMNLTGYNRQKFDQAKQALSKIEKVVYELSLRD